MKNSQETYNRIIEYLTQRSTEQEESAFQKWLEQANDEEVSLYESIRKTWAVAHLNSGDFEPNADEAWNQLQMKVRIRHKEKRSFPWVAAASVILVLSLIATLYLSRSANEPTSINKIALQEIEVVALPDGSQVWLSQNASLSYSESFSEDQREVHLSGKAFFEVAKVNGKRFTIYTKTTKTEVLGTSFNLDASAEEVSIQVTTGKVAFSGLKDTEQVLLTPGKQATYTPHSEKKIIEKAISDENYRAWQNKKLVFSNAKMDVLIETLENHYQTPLEVSDELQNCRFTASFDHQSLESVLEILEITGDLKIDKAENGYLITGKPCI
ncbi:MAG: FecR domain-containing protein [Marinoscillum sp.]